MSQDTPHRVTSSTGSIPDDMQENVSQNGSDSAPLNNDVSQAIVQCLRIAARRGRQIRLAREQAAQSQQNGSAPAYEETSQCDGT